MAYPTVVADVEPTRPPGPPVPVRGARRPRVLLAASTAVALVLLAPLVFLLVEASGAGTVDRLPSDLPAAHGHPVVEHDPAHRGRHRAVRRHRDHGGVVRRAHRPARAEDLGGAGGGPLRHPRLRGQLRVGVLDDLGPRVPRRGAGHDPGRLPAGVPAGGRQPAGCRSRPGGRGPEPRDRPAAHLLPDHPAAGPGGHPRRLSPRGPGHVGRVRGVRDPRLPDLHHRDLHRVPGVVQSGGQLCPGARAGGPGPGGARGRGHDAGQGAGRPPRPPGAAGDPTSPAGQGHGAGPARIRGAGRAGARRAHRRLRLLDLRGWGPRARRASAS